MRTQNKITKAKIEDAISRMISRIRKTEVQPTEENFDLANAEREELKALIDNYFDQAMSKYERGPR